MGICRSSCATSSSSLEYYDAWRHQPMRRLHGPSDYSRHRRNGATTLWMCGRGCCSIRLKLDYAEFQSYYKYAQMSPYVVTQDKTQQCDCVMCRGLIDKTSPRWRDLEKERSSLTDGSLTEDEPEVESPQKLY